MRIQSTRIVSLKWRSLMKELYLVKALPIFCNMSGRLWSMRLWCLTRPGIKCRPISLRCHHDRPALVHKRVVISHFKYIRCLNQVLNAFHLRVKRAKKIETNFKIICTNSSDIPIGMINAKKYVYILSEIKD